MKPFLDTNILIYAASNDPRQGKARELLKRGGIISVQVLNEFVNAARRKLKLDWPSIIDALRLYRDLLDPVRPLSVEAHEAALAVAAERQLDFYDALIIAAAIEAGCDTVLTEDLQDGAQFGALIIRNPFA